MAVKSKRRTWMLLLESIFLLVTGYVSGTSSTFTRTSAVSYNNNNHPYHHPSFSYRSYPTLPYTPGIKPWKQQSTSRKPSASRYYKKKSHRNLFQNLGNILENLLEDISSKILASNIIVFGLQTMNPTITKMGAKVSQLIKQQPHRLLTPVFLHGGLGHLAMNSYSLMNIGPHVESLFGSGRFLATYIMSGVAGNYLSAVMTPNPSVGASGAIFGLISAYYVFLQRNKVFFGSSGDRGMTNIQRTLMTNLVFGFTNRNIDNWGHIGGALGGAAMSYLFGPKLYLMDYGAGGHIIVDKPVIRMPTTPIMHQNLPHEINLHIQRLKRKMQFDGQYSLLPGRPWRKMKRLSLN